MMIWRKLATGLIPDGLGVRIPGFHPGGPGSIPGLGDLVQENENTHHFFELLTVYQQFIVFHEFCWINSYAVGMPVARP